jgi:hypothetical protein
MPADASAADAKTVAVPLPGIKIQRPAKRGDGWRLTLGKLVGRGATFAAAKDDLARQVIVTVATVEVDPGFARDDYDGDLFVALDRPWGIETYIVKDDRARLVATGDRSRTPAEDLAACNGLTPIPLRY